MKTTTIIVMVAVLCIALFAGCNQTRQPAASNPTPSPSGESTAQQNASAPSDPTPSPETNAQSAPSLMPTKDDSDGDGIPDTAEKVLGTNPHAWDTDGDGVSDKDDADPAFTENLIEETSDTALPIEIKDARVEDNATADHLEITMRNTGKEALSDFDIYFTITDKKDGTVEGYYVKLDGLAIKAGESSTIHFDNDITKPGHYFGNMNGLFGTSANGLTFAVQLHANGYKPMDFTVDKAEGTAEVAD